MPTPIKSHTMIAAEWLQVIDILYSPMMSKLPFCMWYYRKRLQKKILLEFCRMIFTVALFFCHLMTISSWIDWNLIYLQKIFRSCWKSQWVGINSMGFAYLKKKTTSKGCKQRGITGKGGNLSNEDEEWELKQCKLRNVFKMICGKYIFDKYETKFKLRTIIRTTAVLQVLWQIIMIFITCFLLI